MIISNEGLRRPGA